MKVPSRQPSPRTLLCPQHHEKYVFVCLHKTCPLAFKIGCIRCRKDHAQHPNRLLSLNDFHALLSKPITYLQTETAFKLLNLKKKVEYIRNFRTQILQREMDLMASNRGIKSTVSAIRDQHYIIRDVMSHIDPEGLNSNFEQYVNCLQLSKQFMTYNPIKGDLTFNNQIIKTSRVQLQKHLQKSQELIDHIREFLVKIIEVLLAHCTHDEDDEDIEYAQQGNNPTDFNIIIKNRTEASQNPNIKNKIEHIDFLQLFDEQKEAMTKQVEMLEREIDNKNTILHKIKSAHSMMGSHICEKSEEDQKQKNWFSKTAIHSLNFKNTYSKEKIDQLKDTDDNMQFRGERNSQAQRIFRDQYQAAIANKNEQIDELKNICRQLQEKLTIITLANQNSCQYQKVTYDELQKEKAQSHNLARTIKELQAKISCLNEAVGKMVGQQKIAVSKMVATQSEFHKRFVEQQRQKAELNSKKEEAISSLQQLNAKFEKLAKQLSVKQEQLQQLTIESGDLRIIKDALKEENSQLTIKLQQQKFEFANKQQSLKIQLSNLKDLLQTNHLKLQQQQQKNNALQLKIKELTKTAQSKDSHPHKIQKDIKRQLSPKLKSSASPERVKAVQVEAKNSKGIQQQTKKYRQTKGLLQISIKKNQELRERNHSLEVQLQSLKALCKQHKKESAKTSDKKKPDNPFNSKSQKKKTEQRIEDTQNRSINSEQFKGSAQKGPLGQRSILDNKADKKQAYIQIKSIFKAVSEDMTVLEERLKQNTVIEKVYLKQLERKRNENKILKKELENFKINGVSKYAEAFRLGSQTSLVESKERLDISSSSLLNLKSKESQLLAVKKYMKTNGK